MTRREAFNTGKPHQSAVAKWARHRLADRGGCEFDDRNNGDKPKQVGCLFADGVGLGKTWEALAAIALLLNKRDQQKYRRRVQQATQSNQKKRVRRRQAHVLILLPPGLVAKWYQELSRPDGFSERLKKWAKLGHRAFVANTLASDNCFEIRKRRDLDNLPRGHIRRRKYTLPAGTYLCNWNVFLGSAGRGRDRVTALKNQKWDVVVVDEAHHRLARSALDKFKHSASTLLLTATPFQLDMTELHGLTKHLVKDKSPAHKVLKRGAVRNFAEAAASAFDKGGSQPTPRERRDAEWVLSQLIACSKVGRQKRLYFVIDGYGNSNKIDPPTELEQESLSKIFDRSIHANESFEEWYLERRLKLARAEAGNKPRHVAMELQKLLSVTDPLNPPAPRLVALRAWARAQFIEDLRDCIKDGMPRKLLVFSHLKTNVTSKIRQALEEELRTAYGQLSRSRDWRKTRKAAPQALTKSLADIKRCTKNQKLLNLLDKFGQSIRGSPFCDFFGNKKFALKVTQELLRIVKAAEPTERSGAKGKNAGAVGKWHAAQDKAKASTAVALLNAIADAPLTATFTGDDTRLNRDAMAEAFRTALTPWILVATNVGSEGIDLHSYSRHLVHFDLEWNPARMEQREGRVDRLGRALKEPSRIYYLLVRDTYDERMFHQMIARQRWHGILLGRKALQLSKPEAKDANLLSRLDTGQMTLNLDPRVQGMG